MSLDSRLLELVAEYEERTRQGSDCSLEELCADCPELIEPLRRALGELHGFNRAFGHLQTWPAAEGGQGPPRVPGYEVLEKLGEGGMGVVYSARQVRADRVVALKMIRHGGHHSLAELARFRTEAEAVARLQHPNIVQVFEVGEHDGLPFFSQEFCAGGSLDRRLRGTTLAALEAAAVVEALARAMHAAHQRNVIHRDLKPANVLLAGGGAEKPLAELTPKIADFGLARKTDTTGQTHTGAVIGTPSYMAPEQAEGRTAEHGPLVDVYALGAILYECLTGRPPFKAATAVETLLQVVGSEPVPGASWRPGCRATWRRCA
jgi:serine/threonine-protein kinase